MEPLKFRTNIKCTGCLATVTPHLNNSAGENNWQVDLADPAKILTVEGDSLESEIKEAIKKAGFEAELM